MSKHKGGVVKIDLDDIDPSPDVERLVDKIQNEIAVAEGWSLMDDDGLVSIKKQEGTVILKREGGNNVLKEVEATWRTTRRFDAEKRKWVPSGFWAVPYTRLRVGFEPVAWRLP